MKKFLITLSILMACNSFAFAADDIDLDGSLVKSKVISSKVVDKSIIAEYPNNVTVQVDKDNHKVQSVRYTKRGFTYKAIVVGEDWNFQRATGQSNFSYNRGGMTYHFYTEKDGTATVYETENAKVIAITRIAKRYYDNSRKYHNQKQLGLTK